MPDDEFERLENEFPEDLPEPNVAGNTREEQYFQLIATAILQKKTY